MSVFLDSELTSDERNEDARFHVIPVPLERTVSYGSGTAKGPAAIIEAFAQGPLKDILNQSIKLKFLNTLN